MKLKGEHVALLAVLVNLSLAGIKYAAAVYSGSIALEADAWHSLTDVVTSLSVFAGLIIARRKSRSFPYGLYKVENFAALIVALMILAAGYGIFMEALKTGGETITNRAMSVAAAATALIVTFLFSRYERKKGQQLNSPGLIADSQHLRTDMYANVVVLFGIAAGYTGYDLDRYAAFAVVFFITRAGIEIFVHAIRVLLDASIDYDTLRKAEHIMTQHSLVEKVTDLKGRNSGSYKFIEAILTVKTHDLDRAHALCDNIEDEIRNEIENVDGVLLHPEPQKKTHMVYALPLSDKNGEILSDHFGDAPEILLIRVNTQSGEEEERRRIENPHLLAKGSRGILLAETLRDNNTDVLITRADFHGKGPWYTLTSAAVRVHTTSEKDVDQAMEECIQLN